MPVLDQDRAFYVDTLGFELVTDRTVNHWRWISLLRPGGSYAIGLVSAPSAGIWTGVSLLTSQLDEVYRRWTQRGVAFDSPPTIQAWNARTTIFSDIHRNCYQLVEVPHPSELAACTSFCFNGAFFRRQPYQVQEAKKE